MGTRSLVGAEMSEVDSLRKELEGERQLRVRLQEKVFSMAGEMEQLLTELEQCKKALAEKEFEESLQSGPGLEESFVEMAEADGVEDEVGLELYASMVRAEALSRSLVVEDLDDLEDDLDVEDDDGKSLYEEEMEGWKTPARSLGLSSLGSMGSSSGGRRRGSPFTPSVAFSDFGGEGMREELHALRLKCHSQRVELAELSAALAKAKEE